jgi:hypothetical protein
LRSAILFTLRRRNAFAKMVLSAYFERLFGVMPQRLFYFS